MVVGRVRRPRRTAGSLENRRPLAVTPPRSKTPTLWLRVHPLKSRYVVRTVPRYGVLESRDVESERRSGRPGTASPTFRRRNEQMVVGRVRRPRRTAGSLENQRSREVTLPRSKTPTLWPRGYPRKSRNVVRTAPQCGVLVWRGVEFERRCGRPGRPALPFDEGTNRWSWVGSAVPGGPLGP